MERLVPLQHAELHMYSFNKRSVFRSDAAIQTSPPRHELDQLVLRVLDADGGVQQSMARSPAQMITRP
ncbi:hypothetical protein PR003_g15645 [Phytophthora rubi]|uniref:Uncharacterized protein n=1 Tax=Phytophthora rubi TaxID=129364 RepID=A0A6A3KWP7_9STRA|nr:hypothetical protein PR002_g15481 [Phytophthora rubi]KAE9329081.1 hypothetical protein PR003_g15645 [Phytophthora rubi]